VGTAGIEKGLSGVHVSMRIGDKYVDPVDQLGCRTTDISRALRLVTPPQPYPRSRANRNTRRNIRSDTHRSSPRWRDGATPGGTRSSPIHASRRSMAES
jgi:hypothetical protein